MEPIPKPLLRRLVLTFLVGTGCFLPDSFSFSMKGTLLFSILSILLFAGSAAKAILLGLQIKRKTYFVLEGTCTDVRLRLFRNSHDIVLTDQDGNEHLLRINKDHKIRSGASYRLYFKTTDSIPSAQKSALSKSSTDRQSAWRGGDKINLLSKLKQTCSCAIIKPKIY